MRVALDAMGGDHAPDATVAGAVLAARDLGIPVWIVGHEDVLQAKLAAHDTRDLPLTVQHAPDLIRMDESPVAIRRKPRCSMRVAFELLRDGTVDAVVSAGNSGAVMAGALLVLGRLPGIERPAIAVSIPSRQGHVVLLDAGANVDAEAVNLVQFAVMGEIHARVQCGVQTPRVGILSNGEEETKGTETTRAASAALKGVGLNFVGYVEGRAIAQGAVDVVVCDGFVGNAVLKSVEGIGELAGELLRDVFSRGWRGRLAYVLTRRALSGIRQHLDHTEYGGAPLLGVDGVTIVAHGSSEPLAIRNAIRVAHEAARLEVGRQIADAVLVLPPVLAADGRRRRRIWAQLRNRLASIRDGQDVKGVAQKTEHPPHDPTD
jgi:glycerol-3-phosphate acyltransferase PlsX